ncbi:Uncharacterized protein APZ42_027809, partial [Daphnia magna]
AWKCVRFSPVFCFSKSSFPVLAEAKCDSITWLLKTMSPHLFIVSVFIIASMKRERGHRYNASGQRYIVRLYEMNRKKTKNQEKLAF